MFEDTLAQIVTDAVRDATAPLVARISELEKLLTATGGERATDLLTRKQVAARLNVSERTVERYVSSGRLRSPVGTGKLKRWRVADIRSFAE
jgi:excisionase family DNA binding protein